MFTDNIGQRLKEVSPSNIYEENDGLFTGVGIYLTGESVFQGISRNANHAELKIENIEISHQRSRTPSEKLTEAGLVIFRAEIEKLLRLSRMSRPDLMYDVLEATQLPQKRETIKANGKINCMKEEEKERRNGERK